MKTSLFAQYEPHTTKLTFQKILKHFRGNREETIVFDKN